MAKNIVLKPLNKTTWNLKTVPSDFQDLLDKIKLAHLAQVTPEFSGDVATLNNTGLQEITAYVSFSNNVLDSFVVTPSGMFYQFTVDVTSQDFDVEWWSFALKNYHVVMSNSDVKKQLAELVSLELKEISGKIVSKGKGSDSLISLRDLFNSIYP